MALVPLGTANVLANEIGLATAPAAVARTIAGGASVRAYVGVANGRCFTAMAGAGFDAHVVANVSLRLKRLFGKGAYVVESLRQLWRFPFPRYRVTVDGQTTTPPPSLSPRATSTAGAMSVRPMPVSTGRSSMSACSSAAGAGTRSAMPWHWRSAGCRDWPISVFCAAAP